MRIQTTVQKWGNSLALRLTGPLRSIPNFSENMVVDIDINESGITVHPTNLHHPRIKLLSEKNLLKGLNKKTAHGDQLAVIKLKDIGE